MFAVLTVLFFVYCIIVFVIYYYLYPVYFHYFPALLTAQLIGCLNFSTLKENWIAIIKALLYLVAILFVSYNLGQKVLSFLNFSEVTNRNTTHNKPSLLFIFSIAIGLILIAYIIFALGLVRVYNPTITLFLLLSGIVASIKHTFFEPTPKNQRRNTNHTCKFLNINNLSTYPSASSVSLLILKSYLVVVLLISFFSALVPCTESDALRYHLAVPELYITKRGIVYYPYNCFSNFPMIIEMLYTLGLLLTNSSILPKLIHFSFFLLTVVAILNFSERILNIHNPVYKYLVAVILVSIPFVPIISSWAFIETGIAFYVFLAIYALLLFLEDRNLSSLVVCGILSGAVAGMKYSCLFVTFIISIILLIFARKIKTAPKEETVSSNCKPSLKPAKHITPKPLAFFLIFLITACLVGLPWYVKSFIYTGNPIYPLLYSVFDGINWSEYNARFYQYHAQTKGDLVYANQQGALYRIAELFLLPIKATFNPVSFDLPQIQKRFKQITHLYNRLFLPTNFGDWQLGPILLSFLPLTLNFFLSLGKQAKKIVVAEKEMGNSHSKEKLIIILSFVLGYYLFWSMTYRDNRFLLPILPLLSLLLVIGVIRWIEPTEKEKLSNSNIWLIRKILVIFILCIMLCYNFLWIIQTVVAYHNPLPVLLGKESHSEYLSRKLPYYKAIEYINANLPGNSKILFIGEYRAFYCKRAYFASDYFDTPVILTLLVQSNSIAELKEKLTELHVDYVLYNEHELAKYYPDFVNRFQSESQLLLFQQFIKDKDLKIIYQHPLYPIFLYRINNQ